MGESALDERGVILLVDDYVDTVDGVGVVSFIRRTSSSRVIQLVGDIRRVTRGRPYRTPRSTFEVGVVFKLYAPQVALYPAVAVRFLPVPPAVDALQSLPNP